MTKFICDRCGKDFTEERDNYGGWPTYLDSAPDGSVSITVHRKRLCTNPDHPGEWNMPPLDLCENCRKKLDTLVSGAMNYPKRSQNINTDDKVKPVTTPKDPVNEMKKLIEQYFGVKFS